MNWPNGIFFISSLAIFLRADGARAGAAGRQTACEKSLRARESVPPETRTPSILPGGKTEGASSFNLIEAAGE
jgi:hypothetical protein